VLHYREVCGNLGEWQVENGTIIEVNGGLSSQKKISSLDELALNMGCPNELAHELIIIFPIQITEHGGIPQLYRHTCVVWFCLF